MDLIVGQKIKTMRPMTRDEMEEQYWDGEGTVLVLENGVKLYPSRDSEGNGPGVIFGTRPDGTHFGLG